MFAEPGDRAREIWIIGPGLDGSGSNQLCPREVGVGTFCLLESAAARQVASRLHRGRLAPQRHLGVDHFHALGTVDEHEQASELADHPLVMEDEAGECHDNQKDCERAQGGEQPAQIVRAVAGLTAVDEPRARSEGGGEQQARPRFQVAEKSK